MYQYDVFISYHRAGATVPAWVRTHFYPRLAALLDEQLDHEATVFFDGNTRAGGKWPDELRDALGRAKILLPVCSPKYFLSEWCLAEWHSMAHREELTGMGSHGLISGDLL
ncbi:TIR domain-containing protein [Actinocrispum wychmicini]|uniref:TIR domain-containing protein n=1 Tax=Actinocrispum wychmicini TaxID=1213861 RepID=A0A4R2JAL8_9PSEU|nr:TIR domain-containing protein [Actinocrispum wychmicini]